MRWSDRSWDQSELAAGSFPAAEAGSLTAGPADEPGSGRLGRDQRDAARLLAGRLARLPDAHPAAWSAADRAGARHGGHPDSANAWRRGETDTWWRGEPDTWWRGPDPAVAEAADDDIDGSGEPGQIADAGPTADAPGAGDASGTADDGRAPDDGTGGETDGRPGGTGGRGSRSRCPRSAAGPARPREGEWGDAGGLQASPAGPDHGPYQPWFSAGLAADPWFAARPAQRQPGS